MEKHRNTELREVCKKIYFVILAVVARRRFLKNKARIVQCQKFVKVCVKKREQRTEREGGGEDQERKRGRRERGGERDGGRDWLGWGWWEGWRLIKRKRICIMLMHVYHFTAFIFYTVLYLQETIPEDS